MRQFIKEYDSDLSLKDCKGLIEFYRAQHYNKGFVRMDPVRDLYYLNVRPDESEEHKFFDEIIFKVVTEAISKYYTDFADLYHPRIHTEDTGYQIQMYEKNRSEYRSHTDAMLPNGVAERQLSVIVYLNTLEGGGATEFKFQDRVIYPKAGKVLIFPATPQFWYKECNHPKKDKFIMTTFITAKYS